jgi:two-component system CheB/CheR fusion protein
MGPSLDAPQESEPSVVCLLCSAGGLEPLKAFFRAVPAGSGLAFLILQHHAQDQQGMLPALLERHGAMPFRQAGDRDPVLPDQALVLTSGMVLVRSGDGLRISQGPALATQDQPGDLLLQSAAACLGPRAVGVVLSGSGRDGTAGLRAVRAAGGLALAQEPASAILEAMPRSAIEAGTVDQVMAPKRMPAFILGGGARTQPSAGATLDRTVLEICALLTARTGQDFSQYKPGTLTRRIQHRMQAAGAATPDGYLALLKGTPDETDALLQALLINITEFFRDPEAFDRLAASVLPEILARGTRPVRIWVPGCASGEEAYSLAILLSELMEAGGIERGAQIFATDIDAAALQQAKAGRYSGPALGNLSEQRRQRFFHHDGDGLAVNQGLRDMCLFSVQNVLTDPPFSSLDLISCRNLFIYLQPALQHKLVPLFHFALNSGGILFLGQSEGLAAHAQLFAPIDRDNRIYRRLEGHTRPGLDFPIQDRHSRFPGHSAPLGKAGDRVKPFTALGLFEQMLLRDYLPASALLNEDGDILLLAGAMGQYLSLAPGLPSGNLLDITAGTLNRELRRLLARVREEPAGILQAAFQYERPDRLQNLRLILRPLPGLDREARIHALVIQDEGVHEGPAAVLPRPELESQLLEQVSAELRSARLELQATVDELGTANEELQASNEELQSSNEELQASQEQLRSLNEELAAANGELGLRVAELQKANADLHNLILSMNNGFAHCRMRFDGERPADFLYLTVNRAFADQTGLGDVSGRWVSEVIPGLRELDPELFERYGRVARGGAPERFETFVDALGQWFDISVYSPAKNEFVAVFDVVTQRKRAERDLKASEEQMKLLIDHAPVALALLDRDMRYLAASRKWMDDYGLPQQELTGLCHYEVFPEIGQAWKAIHQRGLAGETVRAEAEPFLRADGTTQWLRWEVRPWHGADGAVAGIAIFSEDITRRRQADEAIRASEERFALTFNASPDAIILVRHPDGVLLMANEGFTRITGIPVQQAVGRTAQELGYFAHAEDRERLRADLERDGQVAGMEMTFLGRDGIQRFCQVSSRILQWGAEPASISVVRDITAIRAVEEERRLLQAEVDHLQKLDSLGRLAGGVAHDMNNILGAILAVTQTLRTQPAAADGSDAALAILESAALRGKALVKSLLGFGRKVLETPQPVNVNELVRQQMELLDRTLLKKFSLAMELDGTLPLILGEAGPLGNALMNLCVNAIDAMSLGGRLTIRTRRFDQAHLEIEVEDTGEGMAPEVLARAMEPFFTTKPAGMGTGLGLASVYSTARAHGGTLVLSSQEGKGTRAGLRLPCTPLDAAPATEALAPDAGRSSYRILLVDDDELMREAASRLLEVLGHRVQAVEGGVQALALLEQGDPPDVVVLDMNMPDMNGLEALTRLRRLRPTLPVLLASGFFEGTTQALLASDPFLLAIPKPFTLGEIQQKLDAIVRGPRQAAANP